MKIYEIATGYTPVPAQISAATEIVVEELANAMLRQDIDVTVVDIKSKSRLQTNFNIIEVWVPKTFRGTDVKLGIVHKLKRVIYSINLALKLKSVLKKAQEKVVLHFHNQYNMFFFLKLVPRRLREKATVIYTNHSYIWHGEWEEISATIKKRYFQEIICMKAADRVFVLNEKTKKNIVEHILVDSKKVVLIDNGVNTDIYSILSQSARETIKAKNSLKEKTVFIQVGSVCDRKNQLESVKLLLKIMQKNKDVVFCYAGAIISDDYQCAIKKFAKENGVSSQVKYFGELSPGEQLNEFYNMADAMIFPSKAEGFSLVVVEAMSAGVPVFVNESLQFKLSSQCIRIKNADEFTSIIYDNAINNKNYDSLRQKIRASVVNEYGWNKISEDYIKNINL